MYGSKLCCAAGRGRALNSGYAGHERLVELLLSRGASVDLQDVEGRTALMFAAITGQASSVSVLDAMEILGPDLTRFRLRQALELLVALHVKG